MATLWAKSSYVVLSAPTSLSSSVRPGWPLDEDIGCTLDLTHADMRAFGADHDTVAGQVDAAAEKVVGLVLVDGELGSVRPVPAGFLKMCTEPRRGPAWGLSGAPTAMIWPPTATE